MWWRIGSHLGGLVRVWMAAAVEEKVKTAVFKKGLRIAEFSRDYDKRRSGFITTTQFHRTVR